MMKYLSGLSVIVGLIGFFLLDGPAIVKNYFFQSKDNRDTTIIHVLPLHDTIKIETVINNYSPGIKSADNSSITEQPESNLNESPKKPSENYSSFLNSGYINSNSQTEVAVVIFDNDKNILAPFSSSIAKLYTNMGKKGIIGLFHSDFLLSALFKQLNEGNSKVIEQLKLNLYTDYLALGKIEFTDRTGSLVNGTTVCNSTLSVNIINTSTGSIIDSFIIDGIGNGVNESQAKDNSMQKLVSKYSDHLTIN